MVRITPLTLLPLALGMTLLAALPSFGQSRTPAATPQASSAQGTSPVLAPKDDSISAAAPRRNRAISGGVAAALAAAAPKYTPPPPKQEPRPVAEQPDMREVDKPKNTIVRLPDYIVRERKPPVLNERTINTEKGLTDIAVRRYISDLDQALNRFTLPLFGSAYQQRARAMYEEDERLQNISDLNEAARGAAQSDPAAGAYIRRETRETFMRTSDFGWNGGDPR